MKTSISPLLRRADHTLEALAVRRRLAWPLLALLLLLLASAGWAATTRTVTNLDDSGPGSLRETIAASVAGDTIEFAVSGAIALTSGELTIGRKLKINGPGPANLTVSGNYNSRVFRIVFGPVTISGLTISGGYAFGLNGANGTAEIPPQPGTAGQLEPSAQHFYFVNRVTACFGLRPGAPAAAAASPDTGPLPTPNATYPTRNAVPVAGARLRAAGDPVNSTCRDPFESETTH